MVLFRVVGKRVRFGGELHSGWLPNGGTIPQPTPFRNAVVDVRIEHEGGGFLLICDSRNTPDSWDTWHTSLVEAKEHASTQLGIKVGEWKVESDPAVIKLLVDEELLQCDSFQNSHGITNQNLSEHLIAPVCVDIRLNPGHKHTSVWIVLEEHRGGQGYLIGFDPIAQKWALVYRETDGICSLDSYGDSFVGLLEHM